MEEKEVILVETYVPIIHNQVPFQDPYDDFLKTFEEGMKIFSNSMFPEARKYLTTAKTQKEWEWPCLTSMLKEMSKDQSWNHLLDWLYWKREFIS